MGQVVLDRPFPLICGELLDLVPPSTTDDVDADVDSAEYLDCLGDGAPHLLSVGHIGHDGVGFRALTLRLGDDRIGAPGIDVDAGEPGSGPGELEGGVTSVAGSVREIAGAGDNGAPALEAQIDHRRSPLLPAISVIGLSFPQATGSV